MTVVPLKVEVRYPTKTGNFVDISSKLRGVSIARGKSSEADDYDAANASVELNNFEREFDPSFGASEFGSIVQPAGDLRITANNIRIFTGLIYDWNIDYLPDGTSIARVDASDPSIDLAQRKLEAFTPGAETSSERVKTILSRPEVDFAFDDAKISEGIATLASEPIADGTDVTSYLQDVARSEPGRLYFDKDGDIEFKSRLDSLFRTEFTFERRNLCRNPSFEVNGTQWNAGKSPTTDEAFIGANSLLLDNTTTPVPYAATTEFDISRSTVYTASLYVKRRLSSEAFITLDLLDTVATGQAFEIFASETFTLTTDDWTRISVTGTTRSDAISGAFEIRTAPDDVYIDAVLIEETSQLREYFDGDNAPADTDEETFTSEWEV